MAVSKLAEAMNYIEDDWITEAIQPQSVPKKALPWQHVAIIAACLAALIGTLITAEASTGSVSNLLAPLFGITQTEIVDDIGVPLGVSASADGYTLTAEAMIGDRYNVAIVYTLRRDDGQPITEDMYFGNWETNIVEGAASGRGLRRVRKEENPSEIIYIEEGNRARSLLGRYVKVSFSNLTVYDEKEGKGPVVAAGPWNLNYTIRYKDSSINIPVKRLKVTDLEQQEYEIHKIRLSPIGIHLEGDGLNDQWESEVNQERYPVNKEDRFPVKIREKDGTCIVIEENYTLSMSGPVKENGRKSRTSEKSEMSYEAMFAEPIPLEEIEALIICGTEVPIR